MDAAKTSIFISYSHRDRAACDTIAACLEKTEKFVLWYDRGLIAGEEYRKTIAEEIRKADACMVLISDDSVCSAWVLDEVEYAKKLQKKILPVWIENAVLPGDLDMILQRYHSLFWHLRASDSQFAEAILAALQKEMAAEKVEKRDPAEESGRDEIRTAPAELLLDDSFSHGEELTAALSEFRQGKFRAAFQAFTRLAEDNDPKAQLMLARMYAYGLGTPQSTQRSDFWYRSAAKLEDVEAQYAYGAILADGYDPEKQTGKEQWEKGVQLLKNAADNHYKPAMERYIMECSRVCSDFLDAGFAIRYCTQLIDQTQDAYEKETYTTIRKQLRKRQAGFAGKAADTVLTTVCYGVGMLVGLSGALYLVAGMLPALGETGGLMAILPVVTAEKLQPIQRYWDWVLTFLDVCGAYGLELILLGTLIRVAVQDRRTLKFAGIMRKCAWIVYVLLGVWYVEACGGIANAFGDSNLDKLIFAAVAVLISVFIGWALGITLSYGISGIFPDKHNL